QPLTGFAAVVEIQHGCDGVDAQSVDVKLVDPVERVRDEEIANFVAAIVEDQRAPVGMLTETRIFMLEQRSAVETTQSVVVLRKMRRYPIEQNPNPVLMEEIDEVAKVVGRA